MSEFFVSEFKLVHPVHGTFFLSRLYDNERWTLSRVHGRDNDVESIVGVTSPRPLAECRRAVDARIAELDALALLLPVCSPAVEAVSCATDTGAL